MKRKWNAKEVIDRYVYDVVRRLPAKQQQDIESELRMLIEDMLDANDPEGRRDRQHVEAVLYELGKPSMMATRYRGEPRYIIGPEIYDEYWMLMKLVIPIVVIVVLVTGVFGLIFQGITLSSVVSLLGNTFSAGIQAAAAVTFTIALTSYFTRKKDKEEAWNIDDLEEVPNRTLVIKKGEPIASIVFLLIGLTIWLLFSNKIGIYLYQDELTMIPLFIESTLSNYGFLVVIVLISDIVVESLHLLEGRWTIRLAITDIVIHTLSTICALWFVNLQSLFHPDFIRMVNHSLSNIDFPLTISLPAAFTLFILFVYAGDLCSMAIRFWRARHNITK